MSNFNYFFHKSCLQQQAKQVQSHQALVTELQATIAELQSDIARLNKEIVFMQESYDQEIKKLLKAGAAHDSHD